MEAKVIDLNDFEYAGEGANGASYNHKQDKDLMLKLYFKSMHRGTIETEVQRALDVYNAGIPSPKPGDFVTDGQGRYGIMFRRLVGKVSYAREVGNHPEKAEYYGTEFAKLGKEFHSIPVDTKVFPSVKEQYLTMLRENTKCSAEEKAYLEKVITSAPDCDTAIHGDFHFGNALIVGNESYFIDLGEFAHGYPLFDLGMLTIVCLLNDESFTVENFHMDNATALTFYKAFVKEYFDGKLSFEQAVELLLPYAAVKCLLVERNADFTFEVFHNLTAKLMK